MGGVAAFPRTTRGASTCRASCCREGSVPRRRVRVCACVLDREATRRLAEENRRLLDELLGTVKLELRGAAGRRRAGAARRELRRGARRRARRAAERPVPRGLRDQRRAGKRQGVPAQPPGGGGEPRRGARRAVRARRPRSRGQDSSTSGSRRRRCGARSGRCWRRADGYGGREASGGAHTARVRQRQPDGTDARRARSARGLRGLAGQDPRGGRAGKCSASTTSTTGETRSASSASPSAVRYAASTGEEWPVADPESLYKGSTRRRSPGISRTSVGDGLLEMEREKALPEIGDFATGWCMEDIKRTLAAFGCRSTTSSTRRASTTRAR